MEISKKMIREILKEIDILGEVDELSDDLGLVEQGVDSLDMANLYLKLEEHFGIKIPDSDLHLVQSIKNIEEYIQNKLG
ncbi:phosphopantetheine-binding protein [Helicobacter sp. MIT 05-5294]|uniref:phosphopantetheine-binding protein n=1 Tax=Helicobacter sp. MIT 05-5294 TaxID=1548150 RepID=UPI000A7674A4|nr:phosphopantetheine-binding protein [Helicobacter sp. MIT 05-5294]TLD88200.1 acyl carrier protein [Helicobacter sp. MIT 05-5294]